MQNDISIVIIWFLGKFGINSSGVPFEVLEIKRGTINRKLPVKDHVFPN